MYYFFFFFFNDTATTEIYTLSLHDALPISKKVLSGPCRPRNLSRSRRNGRLYRRPCGKSMDPLPSSESMRSEEHTSELQSPDHLVCRLLLEKKKKKILLNKNTLLRVIRMTR